MFRCRLTLRQAQPGQADLLRLALGDLGIADKDIAEEYRRGKSSLLFFIENPGKARRIFTKIRALKLKGFSIRLSDLKDSDWKTAWKKYAVPFYITREVRVVQLCKLNLKIKKSAKDIYIDTTFAFGTGLHSTTRMMAEFIAGRKGDFSSFLDVGTGTGILSIIAHKYGAGQIYAVDFDKEAIATAKRNFGINHCEPCYISAVGFDDFKTDKQFDFVAANLLTADLIRLKQGLIQRVAPGKYLAVSGIYRDNYTAFRNGFRSELLRCVGVLERKGWYALIFKRGVVQK